MKVKTFRQQDELIDYLNKEKKIIVQSRDEHWLTDVNYITIVNPFKELFSSGRDTENKRIYKDEVDFSRLVKCLQIDDSFSEKLFKAIRVFERKLKNSLIIEICSLYSQTGDPKCIRYAQDIKAFIDEYKKADGFDRAVHLIPLFCPGMYHTLSKNGLVPLDDIHKDIVDRNVDLLENILELGTGKSSNGKKKKTKNILLNHYIEENSVTPLWAITNGLSFGDLTQLFSMLPPDRQNSVMEKFGKTFLISSEEKKYNYKALSRFSTKLECVRTLRNTINHFEPVLPVLVHNCNKLKALKSSPFLSAIEMLIPDFHAECFKESTKTQLDFVNMNHSNIVKVKALEYMYELSISR